MDRFGLCFFAITLGTCCFAQVSEFEGRAISDIQYSPGQPLAPQDLAKAQPLRIGALLRAEDVAHAIDGLFATGRFENIAVEAEPMANGVIVRFNLQLTQFVGGMAVSSRSPNPPNSAQIEAASQLMLGAPFHDADVTAAVQNITRLLQTNGLYEAGVTPSVVHDDKAQQVFVTFKIDPGKRAKYEMPTIHGDTKLSDNTILRVTGWRIPVIHWWRQVTDSRTHGGVQDILKKYAKEGRYKADVEVTDLNYDQARHRLHPDLQIDAGPKVKITAVEAKASQRVLKRYVPVFDQGTVDDDLLSEGKRNLTDYFQSKGYYDVEVQFRMRAPESDTEQIEYVIARGERYRLVKLIITGRKYFDEATLRERMFLAPASLFSRHGSYSEAFVRKDEENITLLYRASGFQDVKVTSSIERNYRGKEGDLAVTLHIDEGPQWVVDRLEMNGPAAERLPEIQKLIGSAAGEPFSDVALSMDRENVLTYYYSHGYPAASFNAAWHLDEGSHRVDLVYTIVEGDPQYLRDILISGLKTTRRKMVTKKLTVKPGDPLSPVALANIQKAFYDYGIFSRVDEAIENPSGETAYKHVLYNFEEADRYALSLGFGAQVAQFGSPSSTSLGNPSGTTGFSRRDLSPSAV